MKQSSGNCSQLIIEGFKEALESNQFHIAIKLMHNYEYILQINQTKLSSSLINCLLADPFFMEVKLRLVEQSVRLMDFDSLKSLLAAFETLLAQVQRDPGHNFLVCNQQFVMVSFTIYTIVQEIYKECPRLKTRIDKLLNGLMQLNIDITEELQTNPVVVAQCLKLRDYCGRTAITLLRETRAYRYLQVKVIEEAVKSLWLGKVNFGASFMRQSTAYKTLFVNKNSSKLDFEAMNRSNVLSCRRKIGLASDNAHPLSYQAVFHRMIILYLIEISVFTTVLLLFQTFDLLCMLEFLPIQPIVVKWRENFNAGDDGDPLTDEELGIVVSTMKQINVYWSLSAEFQAYCLLVPMTIINKMAFAKLTQQPFIWTHTMGLDIVIFSLYLYIFLHHVKWKQAQNAGMGFEEDPSPELMYNEEFNKNAA